jgi:hypothetical protein
MKAFNLRGIDPDLAQKMKSAAMMRGSSVNQLAIDLIREGVGLSKEKKYSRRHSDLDELFGRWSEEEFNAVAGKISQERQIDPELWK